MFVRKMLARALPLTALGLAAWCPAYAVTGVAIDLGHGVFSHPPGIPLRGAWLGGV